MILTLPNPPENERSFRFSLESFLSKEQVDQPSCALGHNFLH
jgi:hypothetical protein